MGKAVLAVIDVQKDFISGSLGTAEAQAMLPALLEKVRSFDGKIYLTQDTHGDDYESTQEGRLLPVVHCVAGTDGWAFPQELEQLRQERGLPVFEKSTFASLSLAETLKSQYEKGELDSLEIVGLCTDICVVSNALLCKAQMPELPIRVDASCCAGVTPQKHQAALEVMRSCQILVE